MNVEKSSNHYSCIEYLSLLALFSGRDTKGCFQIAIPMYGGLLLKYFSAPVGAENVTTLSVIEKGKV